MSDRLLLLGSPADRYKDRLKASFAVTQAESEEAFAAALSEGAGIVGIAMFGHWKITPAVMDALPDLKIISNFGVGYDTIDAAEAASRGILVSHTPDVLNDEVADTALMLWLAVSRELVPSERWARSGDWEAKGNYPLTRSIRNRTVGILGMGRIGQAIAETIQPFNPTVVYHTRSPKDVPYTYVGDLVEMAEQCDVLIVITPGGAATHHLVNESVINALGPEGILINVARGTVVDEAALTAALTDGRLGGAGLDVFEEEPKITEGLKALDNVVLLPHVGSGSIETRQMMGDLVCDNLDQWKDTGAVKTPVPECKDLNG
ncbi:MAG: 2-hydroxyacid dehydrogenase [Pseudomonadota bacterium]